MKKFPITELFILGLALSGIAVYAYMHMDRDSAQKQTIPFVEVNGKKVWVDQVKVVQIPQEIYDSIPDNAHWAGHLQGNKKRVFLSTWDGCPYRRAFHHELDKAFGKSGVFKKFYVKDVEETGQSIVVRCSSPKNICPMKWLLDHCMGNICIINPQTHEAIVDDSHDAKQILPLLMAYANWDKEPLLGK